MPEIHSDIGPDYLRDESRKTGTADSISFPLNEAEIADAVRWAAANGQCITTQGARTGLTGGAVPSGGHILNLSRMKTITDRDDLIVQPGVTLDEIRAHLKSRGNVFFAPDPTETTATIGGMASCNASGARSFRYGATRESILAARLVLADGDVIALCREHEIPITLGDFELADVAEADEAFVTGTFGGLTPVRSIDGHALAEALPGPMTVRLRAAYEALKDRDAGL